MIDEHRFPSLLAENFSQKIGILQGPSILMTIISEKSNSYLCFGIDPLTSTAAFLSKFDAISYAKNYDLIYSNLFTIKLPVYHSNNR